MEGLALRSLGSNIRFVAEFESALEQCAPPIQEAVREMLAIIRDPDSDEDERNMAITTILEAVFPSFAADVLRIDEEERKSPEALAVEAQLDREEESFATNLQRVMQERGVTQEELARAAGITQPAISQMLNRRSRPQMRTVRKFAEALQVAPDLLWPDSSGRA